ncbi:hypothetical protein [Marininema halotolerans]|uniref:Uncharacterized protein n=1 Tax=Marininema halotolerans TaxID=1155944 RepID=A0A1I6QKI9_9BACL|nr:hypothetical protein [Marininema halotolerans]SFS52954.1 hypothetical protein SAMN05444972_103210 [Marininema halotolerans]
MEVDIIPYIINGNLAIVWALAMVLLVLSIWLWVRIFVKGNDDGEWRQKDTMDKVIHFVSDVVIGTVLIGTGFLSIGTMLMIVTGS